MENTLLLVDLELKDDVPTEMLVDWELKADVLIEVLVGNSTRGCRMQPFCKQLYNILKYAD